MVVCPGSIAHSKGGLELYHCHRILLKYFYQKLGTTTKLSKYLFKFGPGSIYKVNHPLLVGLPRL